MANAEFLNVPGGRLAYEVVGPADGPLVVALPGMGDLTVQAIFRRDFLVVQFCVVGVPGPDVIATVHTVPFGAFVYVTPSTDTLM